MERAHGRILDQVNQVHSRDEYLSLVYADEDLNGYKLIKVGELEEEMIREASYNSYIRGMYIWFERPQIAATTQGFVRSRAQFDSSLRRNFGVDLDSVEAMARDTGLTLREVGNGRIIAVLASGRRSGDPDRSWETIEVMELDRSAFLSPLAPQSTQGGLTEFWAVLPDGALLAPSQQVQLLAETVGLDIGEAEPEQGTIFRKNFEGRDYAVMTLRSSSGLWMCSAADYSAWSRTVSEHGATVLIFCVGYLLLGLVMAAGFTRANSQPVQRLSNLISEKLTGKEGEGDLAVLEAGVESLLRYWREYAGAQGREERQAREETLYSLLSGRLSQEDFLQTESGREMEFPSQRFAVVCISLRQLTGSFLEGR